jgi:hypothetical protein
VFSVRMRRMGGEREGEREGRSERGCGLVLVFVRCGWWCRRSCVGC